MINNRISIVFIVALDKNEHKYMRSSCGGHPRLNTLFSKQGLVDQGKRMMALTCAYAWGGRFQGVGTSVGLVFFGYQLDIYTEDFTFLDTNRVC